MMKKIIEVILVSLIAFLLLAGIAWGQSNGQSSYSPFAIFGNDIRPKSSAWGLTVGNATTTRLYTDYINNVASSSYALYSNVLTLATPNQTITQIPNFNGGTSGASAPFTVDSTFKVTNLNADLLDGYSVHGTNGIPIVTGGATIGMPWTFSQGLNIYNSYITMTGELLAHPATHNLRIGVVEPTGGNSNMYLTAKDIIYLSASTLQLTGNLTYEGSLGLTAGSGNTLVITDQVAGATDLYFSMDDLTLYNSLFEPNQNAAWLDYGYDSRVGNTDNRFDLGYFTDFDVADELTVSGVATFAKAAITQESTIATSTSMTVDWGVANQQLIRLGTDAVTIGFTNYEDGQTLRLIACNPATTTSTITWSGVLWPGGVAPAQTTTASKCDTYTFLATNATSSLAIFGGYAQDY